MGLGACSHEVGNQNLTLSHPPKWIAVGVESLYDYKVSTFRRPGMHLERMSTSPSDYVVLDVETNGLSSTKRDLLSIAIFKPDDKQAFERFLPLDLDDHIPSSITQINGITEKMLRNQPHLSQNEVNWLFEFFDLSNRTILHFGSLDKPFIKQYFKRNNLDGFDRLHFFNFKHLICSSRYSSGNLSKDNLCTMFGIEGVRKTHSGLNDCMLEWKLFQAIGGHHLLVTPHGDVDEVFRLNDDYLVPVSYLATYPNLSKLFERPFISCDATEVKRFTLKSSSIRKFPNNISGMTIEHLINSMLKASKEDNFSKLLANKAKLECIGSIASPISSVSMSFNDDGTVTAIHREDEPLAQKINEVNQELQQMIRPVVDYIWFDLFHEKKILSQELVTDLDMGILALCDLSSVNTVLEIKTYPADPNDVAEQLYYEAHGRDSYLLTIDWQYDKSRRPSGIDIVIYRVIAYPGTKTDGRNMKGLATVSSILNPIGIDVVHYKSSTLPIRLSCCNCGTEWNESYQRIKGHRAVCPTCHPQKSKRKNSAQERDKTG